MSTTYFLNLLFKKIILLKTKLYATNCIYIYLCIYMYMYIKNTTQFFQVYDYAKISQCIEIAIRNLCLKSKFKKIIIFFY